MRPLTIAVTLLSALLVSQASAQKPTAKESVGPDATATDGVTKTPEMWFYEQQWRRHEDPAAAVRRKAEFRADQRQKRIAARRWYGLSNSRPTVSSTPWSGLYSPTWVSNTARKFGWAPSSQPTIVIQTDETSRR